jgi:hypothetical protein
MKTPINTFKYSAYRDKLKGYSIRRRGDQFPITKIEFFWKSTDNNILDLFNGKHESFELYDTPGWVNGKLFDHNFYTKDMVDNMKRMRA